MVFLSHLAVIMIMVQRIGARLFVSSPLLSYLGGYGAGYRGMCVLLVVVVVVGGIAVNDSVLLTTVVQRVEWGELLRRAASVVITAH